MNSNVTDSMSVLDVVAMQSRRTLDVYRADPGHVQEHANNERRITQGGYGTRQIYELVQNGADENLAAGSGGRISVVLSPTALYCANTGTPMSALGADTILRMAVSRKRGGQIGRFGVGFKSVLTVTDTPRIYSETGCFGFDKQWSAARIREVVPDLTELDETPVLRMALPLDPGRDRADDPVLDELLDRATTVVVLPLLPGVDRRLGNDLRGFPRHFMLFSPHVDTVLLEDRRPGKTLSRELSQSTVESAHHIEDRTTDTDGRTTVIEEEWSVFHRDYTPSPEAMRTAGELHERPQIRISWAVPAKGVARRTKRGAFWAFFPTHYETTLTGILNAPWKTPEDRQNLTESDFNSELVGAAAELVIRSLPRLVEEEDPGSYLNLLTARGREASQWGDDLLSREIIAIASREASVPDQSGVLRKPEEVRLHPPYLLPDWLRTWASIAARPANWCHHTVEQRERRSRVRDYMDAAGVRAATATEWLEALVADRTAASSVAALRIAADMQRFRSVPGEEEQARSRAQYADEARRARILLTETGELVAPSAGSVFRRSAEDDKGLPDGTVYAHPDVTAGAKEALETLGVAEANAEGRLKAVISLGVTRYGNAEWAEFWKLVRRTGARASVIVRQRVEDPVNTLKVRTLDGTFRPIRDTLLAGRVVPADGTRDAEILVDPAYHRAETQVLRELGATDGPVPDVDPTDEPWFEDYRVWARERYCKTLQNTQSRPSLRSIHLDGAAPAGPLHLLQRLSPEGCAAFVRHLPREGLVRSWTLRVGSGRGAHQEAIASPLVWLLHRSGRVHTSLGIRKPATAVPPDYPTDPRLLPVADVPENVAQVLPLRADPSVVPLGMWAELLLRVVDSEDPGLVGKGYLLLLDAMEHGHDLESLEGFDGVRCQVGEEWTVRPEEEVAVTHDEAQYGVLKRERVPALLVPTEKDCERLVESWGLKTPSEMVQEELDVVEAGEPVLLTDLFPRLRHHLPRGTAWKVGHCSSLAKVVRTPDGRRETALPETRRGDTVLLCGPDDELEILLAVDRVLRLRLGRNGCQDLLAQQRKDREGQRFQEVRQERDPARKLLLALGAERLRAALPPGLLLADEELNGEQPDDLRIAQLAVATHGDEVLARLADELREAGFDAPHNWAGGATARTFVKDFGFPVHWAGDQEDSKRPLPFENVEGPRKPQPLHQYQMRLVANMYQHLVQDSEKRALLQIPTGSGKTRIAVEATVQAIADGEIRGPVLWIAQSVELCEQAIETWKFVWRQAGPDRTLRISRMWAGTAAEPANDRPQVVVAIDDSLARHIGNESYAWLREASVVIVDEAHFAVPKTYTKILNELGIDQHRTSRHLVGLTATAFRGSNTEETSRLVARFGHKRLDHGVFENDDPYPHLQSLGVLSKVEMRELAGGDYLLDEGQLALMTSSNNMALPADVTTRMAEDVSRTRRIVEEIERLPEGWPVLVFATSVDHSKVLAALLNESGIPSASVDAKTPSAARNRRIAAFRRGEIKVLTNYNVLTQGFDAPAVRAVVVARPTFSPNTYVQMIGRGLRGPLNGGKDSCLILNVRDNIKNFGRSLAYTELEYLWEK
ncbi:DEAD/DEAH box helicase [Streptomyces sp. enrichment culture]|uniref:DEAD/DEAH box helicase n=1 Tax=Streptomyces sp. enrichment culture TaxID=1795815 RepID=UPI003F56AB19